MINRFLGIDTPEIKEKQPFAEEAKAYTKGLCDKKEIYLTFDDDKEDHYGRLLAFVWVKVDAGYLCVNQGIVAEGLAYVYLVKKSMQYADQMLSLQKEARQAKKGLWSSFVDKDVLATQNGSAYHQRGCTHISNSHNLKTMKISQAVDSGLHPCRTCST